MANHRVHASLPGREMLLPMGIHYRGCPDAGVECLGYGEVMLKVQVVP